MAKASTRAVEPVITVKREGVSVEGSVSPVYEGEELVITQHRDWPIMFMTAGLGVVLLLLGWLMVATNSPAFLYLLIFATGVAALLGSLFGESRRKTFYELLVINREGHARALTISHTRAPLEEAVAAFKRMRAEPVEARPAPSTEAAGGEDQVWLEQLLNLSPAHQLRIVRLIAASATARMTPPERENFLRELRHDIEATAPGAATFQTPVAPH